jgi:hypothetical protein
MKNLKFLLTLSFAGFLLSCNDAIDITQPGELTEDKAFQTVSDLESGLSGVYASFSYENAVGFTSIFTDEIKIGFANGGQGLSDGEYAFVLNPASGDAASIWSANYSMINRANRIIRAATTITFDAENPGEVQAVNNIVGQARAMRAFAHLQLLTYFSTDMTDNNALGVILMDYVPEVFGLELPRSTNGEVYELIESDLAFAEENISSNVSATRTFLSKSFVYAAYARMYAYRGLYAQALPYITQLDALYNLTPKASYPNIWADAPITPPINNEVIFKLERTGTRDNRIGGIWFSVNQTITGSPFYEVGNALHDVLNPTNAAAATIADVRYATIFGPQSNPADDILLLNKYPGSEGLPRLNDVKVFRFSEFVLIRAEAFIDAGNLAGAAQEIATLKEIRRGVAAGSITPTVYANATEAWADVLRERRIEFAFEGHRYIDLKRLGAKANAAIDRAPEDCEINGACTLPIGDYRFTMPIPLIELNANTVIQQNPNY